MNVTIQQSAEKVQPESLDIIEKYHYIYDSRFDIDFAKYR